MPEKENARLNPQIVDVEIGIRELRKIKIYPLSMKDQLDLTNLIVEALNVQVNEKGSTDLSIAFLVGLIRDNLEKVLKMATDEENIMSEISNVQAMEIAEKLFDVNFASVAKNFKSLSEKAMNMFQSERPSQPSVSDTGTDSNTSTKEVTEKGE